MKTRLDSEKIKQLLIDARNNLERRLALSVGQDNYNQGPLNDALNAIDMQVPGIRKDSDRVFDGTSYKLDALLDEKLRAPVRRVLKHVNGVSAIASPDSLDYSAFALALGLKGVDLKWAMNLPQIRNAANRALNTGVIVHDLEGLTGNGFTELKSHDKLYLKKFHDDVASLMAQRIALEKNGKEYAVIGVGALGGAGLGLGVGYVIDTSNIYNFYTQLLLARFPVAMLESAGIAIKPIYELIKRVRGAQEQDPVLKDSGNSTDTFAKWGLAAAPSASLLSMGGEVSGLNTIPSFDGFVNVELNNGNNQIGLVGMYNEFKSKYGVKEGTRRFFRDPFVISNLIVTGGYLAAAIGGRATGLMRVDSGVKSGGEAGFISSDTAIASALALTAIYANYLIRHQQMLRSGIRERIYINV